MKRVVLAIAAALILIALPAAAQYDNSASTSQPSTTDTATTNNLTTTDTTATTTTPTTSDTAGGAPVQEERTNPQVPTHSPNAGLTATGEVASWNDDEVVLRTATGVTHFKLLPATTGLRDFTAGQRVTIDFDRNEQGVLIAKQIRLEGEATAMNPPGITTPGAAEAGAAVSEAASNVGEAVEEGVEETVGADVDNDNKIGTRGGTATGDTASTTTTTTESTTTSVDTSSNLPATGSNAPLFGLLGLLALGGAAALRRV